MIELIGYLGSIFVAISLLMSNVFKLRVINLLGAIFFVIYGILIKAHSVWLVNLFVAIVDLYYIIQLKSAKNLFKFINSSYNELIDDFIKYHYDDIIKFFPEFKGEKKNELLYYIIVRNFIIVGVFGYKYQNGKYQIIIDYIKKEWRDLKNAINFFKTISQNENFNGKTFFIKTENSQHIKYLKKIGFTETSPKTFEYTIN